MYNIQLMNKIAAVGTNVFDKASFTVAENVENPTAMMVRSASLHETEFPASLLAIARAGAGVNNIPLDTCAEKGIVVFNTPGANANGVKELAIAALLLASRDIVGGIEWVKANAADENLAKSVEKSKAQFAGHEIFGKTLGVIGLGAIGGLVANAAHSLGMNVVGCDPYLTVGAAWSLSRAVHKADSYDDIYAVADYITLHVPSTPSTKGMINKETLAKMKDGVRIINLARADLVNTEDIKEALESGKVAAYITDFPIPETVGLKNTVNIPHLGASTEESEDNCAIMAAQSLVEYITTGNIRNSVNYPAVSIPHTGASRICLCHRNVSGMLSKITAILSAEGINIENLSNSAKGDFAYTIIESGVKVSDAAVAVLTSIPDMIRVRVID
jgi:D-3-phosphoglycerate dehydrogenase